MGRLGHAEAGRRAEAMTSGTDEENERELSILSLKLPDTMTMNTTPLIAAVLSFTVMVCGCSPSAHEDTAAERARLETGAIAALKRMPEVVIKAKHYSIRPEVVHLQDGQWVAEVVAFDNVQWDYRWTESPGFPIEGILGFTIRRWITKPYSTKEAAEAEGTAFAAGGSASQFFEVYVTSSYPRSYPTEPIKLTPGSPEALCPPGPELLMTELAFCAATKSWEIKSSDLGGDYDAIREKWASRLQSPISPAKKGPSSTE